jgi:hypothetical protein
MLRMLVKDVVKISALQVVTWMTIHPYNNACYGVIDYGNFWTVDTYTSN